MAVPKNLAGTSSWKNLRSLGKVIRRRVIQGVEQHELQFYISSLPVKVKRLAKAIRGHWSIENQLDWMLDVVLHRMRAGFGREMAPRFLRCSGSWP